MPTENTNAAKFKGPHGLGDPDDTKLRKVELDVLIPKKMRDIAQTEMCLKEVSGFNSCCKEAGLSMVYKCRTENTALWGCLEKWYFDDDFRQRCTNEYLTERAEYRRTGIKKKAKNLRSEIRAKEQT